MITLTPPIVPSAADLAEERVAAALHDLGERRRRPLAREDVREAVAALRAAAAFLEPLTSALPTRDELAAREAVRRRAER